MGDLEPNVDQAETDTPLADDEGEQAPFEPPADDAPSESDE